MSVHAGTILLVAGNNVVDRLQSHGLGDVRVPIDTIREVGNELVVDKIPTEADFTFSLESLDTSTEIEALITGKVGTGVGSALAAGYADADGTEYKWADCQPLNLASPWKDAATGSAGTVAAGHVIPGYYPTRIRYRFGVTDNAVQEVELAGGSFYYGQFAPVEEIITATGGQTAFSTADPAIRYRKGGVGGSTFKSVFGVIVNGVLQTDGVDYVLTGGAAGPGGATATVTLTVGALVGQKVRFCYFTPAAKSYPQSVHASTVVKPGAVRGRNICVSIAPIGSSSFTRLAGVQSAELEATVDGTVDREFCNEDPTGRTINGLDCTGNLVVRSKNPAAFFDLLEQVTGVDYDTEVGGFLNTNPVQLRVEIQNPRDPGTILKTLYVADAIFQIPGTPARVNTPTDFSIAYEAQSGTYSAFKGARA